MVDEIKKFIQIILNIRGHKEAGDESDKFFKKHHEGVDQAKKDAEEGDDKILKFLGRWKSELMLLGGAVAGIYALVRYSSVAHTMMDLFGKSVGLLADLIIIRLIPGVLWLTSWIFWLGKAFQGLPDIMKDIIAWGFGTIIALVLISKAIDALGIAAKTSKLLLGALAGLIIGIEIVLLLREVGFFKALGDVVGKGKADFQNFIEDLSLMWENFWIRFRNYALKAFKDIPGMGFFANTEFEQEKDKYDKFGEGLAQYAKYKEGKLSKEETPFDLAAWDATYKDAWERMTAAGNTPEGQARYMRSSGQELAKHEFTPPDQDWVDRTAGDDAELRAKLGFVNWAYNNKEGKSGLGALPMPPGGGATSFPTMSYDEAMAQWEEYKKTTGAGGQMPGGGASAAAASTPIPKPLTPAEQEWADAQRSLGTKQPDAQAGAQYNFDFSNATVSMDPGKYRDMDDYVNSSVNRAQSMGQKRGNTYG